MADADAIRVDSNPILAKKKVPQEVWWVTSAIAQVFDREYYLLILTKELVFYFIFLFCVTFAAVVKIDPMAYIMTHAVQMQLINPEFKSETKQDISFYDIRTGSEFFSYLNEIVANKIYKNTFTELEPGSTDAQNTDRGLLYYNRILGQPTLRQVTAKNISCHPKFENYFSQCYARMSFWTRSKDKLECKTSACKYTKRHDVKNGGFDAGTRATTYWGKVEYYEAGGYQKRMGTTEKEFRDRVRMLSEDWVQKSTRAIFLDMQFYNPHIDLFSVVKLIFEIPPTGQLVPSFRITTFQCDKQYTDKAVRIAEGCMIVCSLYILYYLAEELRQLVFFQWSYFNMFWPLVSWIIIITSTIHLIAYVLEKQTCHDYYTEFSGSTNNFYPLQYMAWLENLNTNAQACAIFFVYLKLFKYICLNTNLGHLHFTLRRSGQALEYLFLLFLLMILAFAMAGHIMFGTDVEQFSSVTRAMMTLLRTYVGDFFYAEIGRFHPHWGPIYFTAFIVVFFFILMHLFLAVLSATFTEVKTDMGIAPHRIQLCGFWGRGCANCLRDCGCAVCVPEPLATKRYSASAEEIRTILKRCGFSELDIDMFMARYNIDPHEEIRRRDVSKLIETIRIPTSEIAPKHPLRAPLVPLSPKSSEKSERVPIRPPVVTLQDFTIQQDRLDRLESIMGTIAERLERLLKLMNTLDQKRTSMTPKKK